jgi:hypothetical protein
MGWDPREGDGLRQLEIGNWKLEIPFRYNAAKGRRNENPTTERREVP